MHDTAPIALDKFRTGDLEQKTADGIFGFAATSYAALYDEIAKQLDRILRKTPRDRWSVLIEDLIKQYEHFLGSTLTETIVASYLAGGQNVAEMIPPWAHRGYILPPPPPMGPLRQGSFLPPEPIIEFPIIEQAARDLYGRRLMQRSVFDRLSQEARANAFTVAGIASEATLGRIRDTLAQNVAEGANLRGFRQAMAEVLEESPMSPDHLETVFRTNVQTGFSRGMTAVLDHPFVTDLFPYEEFVEIHDGRLCKLCRTIARSGLNGTSIYRRDDPVWRKFTPPCHWNCRCARIPTMVERAASRGVKEAQLWHETGNQPMMPTWVPHPMVDGMPLQLPRGWAA